MTIRAIDTNDKEWVLNIAENYYSKTDLGWVRADAASTFDKIMASKGALFIREEKTFLFALISVRLCDYTKRDAYMELLVGEGKSGLEPYRLLVKAKEWAKENNVDRFTISSVTEHTFSQLLMKRLGATPRIIYDIYSL